MQVKNVTRQQLESIAAFIGVRAIDAYARPGWTGICLRPSGAMYRRTGPFGKRFERFNKRGEALLPRRVNAVCWCGHRRFLVELFLRHPDAVVISSSPVGRVTIVSDKNPPVRPCWYTLSRWLDASICHNVGNDYYYVNPTNLCIGHTPARIH